MSTQTHRRSYLSLDRSMVQSWKSLIPIHTGMGEAAPRRGCSVSRSFKNDQLSDPPVVTGAKYFLSRE